MSCEFLMDAVADRLRSVLNLTREECDIMPDGQPPGVIGEHFYAIHPGEWQQTDENALSLDEVYGLAVTLTLRTGYPPHDRIGTEILTRRPGGLFPRAKVVRAKLHMDYVTMNNANTEIGPDENGYIEPLKFRNAQYLGPVGPSWFFAEGANDPPSGVAIQLNFGGARRVQVIEEQS